MQQGKTKVFLRQAAFEYMERFRTHQLDDAATKIQALARGYIARRNYSEYLRIVVRAQAHMRRFLAKKFMRILQQDKAATLIQAYYRMVGVRSEYLKKKYAIQWLQKHQRGHVGRKLYAQRVEEVAMATADYKAATAIQCLYRKMVVTARFKELKDEARAKRKLENKTSVVARFELEKTKAELKAAKTAAIAKGRAVERDKEVDELAKEFEKTRLTADKVGATKEEISKLNAEVAELKAQLETSRKSSETALFKLAAVELENKKLKEQISHGVIAGPAYSSSTYKDHFDLQELDERIFGIVGRSKQSKKELDALVASLAILKQAPI